jgi:hypothetical protein
MRAKSTSLKLLAIPLILCLGMVAYRLWYSGSEYVAMLGTHRLVISPAKCHDLTPDEVEVLGDDHSAGYHCPKGGVKVILDDNNLAVNYESYGALEPGDEIAIMYGEVYINGSRRMPSK